MPELEEKVFIAIMGKQFLNFLENIPQEKINRWKEKNGIDIEPIIPNSTATAKTRSSCIIRISSYSYIWR